MARGVIVLALFFGFIVLAVALFGPGMIEAFEGESTSVEVLAEGEGAETTETLQVNVTDVNVGGQEVTVRLENLRTAEQASDTIGVGNTSSIALSGELLPVGVQEIRGNDDAVINITHSPAFGWDEGPRLFWEQLGLIVAIAFFLSVFAILVRVVVV